MRNSLIAVLFSLITIGLNAQTKDANYIVDYSQAIICGMDEETFAVIEPDWKKDNPEITGNMIESLLEKTSKILPFKKSSPNTIIVQVLSITENGKFNCNVELIDASNNTVFKVNNITCSKGGTWGTKLHLMKEGAHNEGRNIGNAIKKALKDKKYKQRDKYEL